mgnify:CR=1 FL=1
MQVGAAPSRARRAGGWWSRGQGSSWLGWLERCVAHPRRHADWPVDFARPPLLLRGRRVWRGSWAWRPSGRVASTASCRCCARSSGCWRRCRWGGAAAGGPMAGGWCSGPAPTHTARCHVLAIHESKSTLALCSFNQVAVLIRERRSRSYDRFTTGPYCRCPPPRAGLQADRSSRAAPGPDCPAGPLPLAAARGGADDANAARCGGWTGWVAAGERCCRASRGGVWEWREGHAMFPSLQCVVVQDDHLMSPSPPAC